MRIRILFVALLFVFIFAAVSSADEIKGRMQSVDAQEAMIDVAGVKINTQGAKITDRAGLSMTLRDISDDDYIDVEGYFTGPGEMKANKIYIGDAEPDRIEGKIESIDIASRQLVIGGINVKIFQYARIRDKNGIEVPFEKIAPRKSLRCDGSWTGNLEFTASIIATSWE
ncbi:MAG: DUF5666 domain-containing protein [Candidatus Omnitrophica bacterium]|nr:DUF5666 domain-containing protein [Candidatus Omnitrophota bacterium]